jgi:hypothetical protein
MKKILLFALCFSQAVSGSVIYVSSLQDNGPGTLREGINLAAPGDTIDFSTQGTIDLNSALVINKSITILSPSSDSVIINGQNQTHLIEIISGDVYIHNLFFQSGFPVTPSSGGAIRKYSPGFARISNSKFFGCKAKDGGAISQDTGRLEIIRCYFYNNDADSSGGSIRSNGGSFYIYGCTFEESSSGLSGGALSNFGNEMHIVNSTFYHNVAGVNGGVCAGDSITMINCTLTGNTANGSGGAIYPGNGYLLNSIVYDNTANAGANFSGPFVSYGHNLLGDTSNTGHIDSTDIINVDPLLNPISSGNGGVTPTCSINAGSPCIDAGACVSAPDFDQRDSARVGHPDIGAYEFGGIPYTRYVGYDSMCVGDTIFFDNDTITTEGITTQILEDVMRCDSIIDLNVSFITIDTAVTQNGDTISASSFATAWQWIDCNTMTSIPGAINQTFVASVNGSYAALVTQNGCTDTSACITLTTVGVENLSSIRNVHVYPTVTSDFVNIYAPRNVNIQLMNLAGEIIFSKKVIGSDKIIFDLSDFVNGIYFLRAQDYVVKIVKQ